MSLGGIRIRCSLEQCHGFYERCLFRGGDVGGGTKESALRPLISGDFVIDGITYKGRHIEVKNLMYSQ